MSRAQVNRGTGQTPAILYAAKSSQDTHGSIPTQIEDCRAAALAESIDVAGEYTDEAYSAYSGSRGPGLKAAMEHAERLAAEHGEFTVFKTKDTQPSEELPGPDGWLCGPDDERLGTDGEFIFVLRPEYDWEAFIALRAYAQLVRQRSPHLADQLDERLNAITEQQLDERERPVREEHST